MINDLLYLVSYCALTETNMKLGTLPEDVDPPVKIEHASLTARNKHHIVAKIQMSIK